MTCMFMCISIHIPMYPLLNTSYDLEIIPLHQYGSFKNSLIDIITTNYKKCL